MFALVWLLIILIPGIWKRTGFDRTRPDPGGVGNAGGLAMVGSGVLIATTPWWAAPTHYIDGVNTALILVWPLLAAGCGLVVLGLGLLWGGRVIRLRMAHRAPRGHSAPATA